MKLGYSDPELRVKFHGAKIRVASLISIKIKLYEDESYLGSATGFFVLDGEKPYLVSNWHVFSGRNWQDGQPVDPYNRIPNRIIFFCHREGFQDDGSTIARLDGYKAELCKEGKPIWLEHQLGQDCDVAVLPLTSADIKSVIIPANYGGSHGENALSVGKELMIVGFPEDIPTKALLPIWKRGTVASETLVRAGKTDKFYLDAATRRGMSGSPVFSFQETKPRIKDGNLVFDPGYIGIVGVYSGRVGAKDRLGAELGICWPVGLVDDIIRNGVRGGDYKLRKVEDAPLFPPTEFFDL